MAKKREWTDKEKLLLAINSLLIVHDHQHNMHSEISNVRKKYSKNECALEVIDEVSKSVAMRMTAGDIDRIAIEALKIAAPEMYDDHVPIRDIFKKLDDLFK